MSSTLDLFARLPSTGAPAFDATFSKLESRELSPGAWVDFAPGWLQGHRALFDALLRTRNWKQRTRKIFDKPMLEPRLTAPWVRSRGDTLEPPIVEAMRACLSARYGVDFDSIGFNHYRDGDDAVAWHRDQIPRSVVNPIVVLVGLGAHRKLLLRPHGGGKSLGWPLGEGNLLVTRGNCQRTWEHCIPRVSAAGPRISLAFRHGMEASNLDY